MTGYLPREISSRLEKALKVLPVVVVSGLRQAGKSTLLQNDRGLASGHIYRTLDDFATLQAARSNPESLLAQPTILDEAQRCPELFLTLKKMVDENRQPGRFILSGSANMSLIGMVTESLAGRAGYFELQPMTRRERLGRTSAPAFLVEFLRSQALPAEAADPLTGAEVMKGGLPPACLSPLDDVSEWFRGYIQTYIERDVRQLSQIADFVSFRNLAQLAAFRTGQVLVASSLARDAKLSASTASRYLDLLEVSFLIRRLPPFVRNRTSRLVKSPKMYVTDSGVAARLAGVESIEASDGEAMRGALFETYVAQNLVAILEAHLPDVRLTYWHEQGRHEVDFVIESGSDVLAIEVKAASRWNEADLRGLRVFLERTPNCVAAVLAYNGTTSVQLDDRLFAIPLGTLLA